uniref:DnaJ domain-containing protein n=1 Tax=Aquipuribacter hungaricus TaxID=545624 RepID=UPI0030EC39D8
MTGQDWLEKDFYGVLGVPKTADAAAVKKAYRTLARTHHPDANGGDAASEKRFKEVGEAYSVLSDPEKRQQYDAVRAMRSGARFTAGSGGPGGAGGAGFEDIFGGMFGAGSPGAGRGRAPPGQRRRAVGSGGFDDLLAR